MRIILYYPPLFIGSAMTPYPSLPLLAAYIKKKRNYPVIMKDINVDLINKMIELSKKNGVLFKMPFFQRLEMILSKIFLRDSQIMPLEKAEFLTLNGLKLISDNLSIDFRGYSILKTGNSGQRRPNELFDFWNLEYRQLRDVLHTQNENPLLSILEKNYFDDALGEKTLIGISVPFISQITMALIAAKHIKKLNSRAFIAIGGPAIRLISKNFEKIPELFDIIDCFVETEGEDILVELADSICYEKDWKKISGLIYFDRQHKKVIKNPPRHFSIDTNVPPDISLLKNHRYLRPDIFFMRTSIGCYHNKCAFCTIPWPGYQERSVGNIINDIAYLQKTGNIKKICFSDEVVPPQRLVEIADALLKNKITVRIDARSRFDTGCFSKEACAKLARAGIIELNIGLESASQRINNLMNKGITIDNAKTMIRNIRNSGISCYLNGMIGFPGETEDEVRQTVRFLRAHRFSFYAYLSIFSLNCGSFVYRYPERYGITKIYPTENFIYKESYDFDMARKIPLERLLNLRKMYKMTGWNKLLWKVTLHCIRLKFLLR